MTLFKDKFSIIDISPSLHSETAVWPGDKKWKLEKSMSFAKGHHMELGSIHTSLHIGAHADSPLHYMSHGLASDDQELQPFLGLCQVISVDLKKSKRIQPEDLAVEIRAPRILFKTMSFPNPNHFNTDFMSLSPELIEFLSEKKVVLIGIDTPSVDPFEDQAMLSHKSLHENKIYNLEGLVLDHVRDGLYDLIALPLKMEQADASPVRAILLENLSANVR